MLQALWYHLGRTFLAQYSKLILRMDIQNKAPIPPGPKIIVANHPSTTDPAWVTVLIKEHASILIKELLFKVPLFGRSLRLAGHIPVIANEGKKSLEKAADVVRAGRTVIIFPEGEISNPDGCLRRAHTGAARLALLTGAPVIPVGIGLDPAHLRAIPARVDGMLDVGYWYLHGPYAMTSGYPSKFEGNAEDRTQVYTVLEQIMQQVSALSHESAIRIRACRPVTFDVGSLVSWGWRTFGTLFFRLSSI